MPVTDGSLIKAVLAGGGLRQCLQEGQCSLPRDKL